MYTNDYLALCLNEIEKKLSWGTSSSWKDSDYIELARLISEATQISISSHTLKRLFGKITYNENYNPQRATKNALAIYLGYSDWKSYVSSLKVQSARPPSKSYSNSVKWTLGIFLAFLALSLFFIFSEENAERETFSFSVQVPEGKVPYTVSIDYDISQLKGDSLYADFNFLHPTLGTQIKKLNKNRKLYNYTYQIPGQYSISLLKNGNEIDSVKILAKSNGWESFFENEKSRGLWIDNKIEPHHTNGFLHFSKPYLDSLDLNTNAVFYLTHRMTRPFNISGDHFEMEVKFRNGKETGGITCYDFLIRLFAHSHQNHLYLMEEGCSGYSSLKIGNTKVSGVQENLKALTFDQSQWNILRIKIESNEIEIWLNNQKSYSGNYHGTNGELLGVDLVTKGSGKVDYFQMMDLGTGKVFREDFN